MDATLATVADITGRQLALITRSQLDEHGIKKHIIERLVSRRVIERVRPQVYALVGAPDSWERGLLAAVLSAGEGAAASHSSGARLCVFSRLPEVRYEIVVPTEVRPRLVGVGVHRTTMLDAVDITIQSGIPCTTFERTLCDCTTRLTPYQLGRVLDDGLRRGVASLSRLKDCAERLDSGPGRHMSLIRTLLAERDVTYDPGGSDDELRVLRALKRAGLPLPAQQQEIVVNGKTYRPDYSWSVWKVFAEYYGRGSHIGAGAVAYDNERVTALATAGWLPLIFTWQTSDARIVEETVRALEQRGVWTLRSPESA